MVSATFAGLLLLLANANANAGEKGCDSAVAVVSPFFCQLERVDTVRLQLDGSARVLGANRLDMERIMRERLESFLATLPNQTADATSVLTGKRPQRGQLACTLWTVGQGLSIALFVECALQSPTTGDSVDARLLGRTTEAEFDMAARVALGRVVSKVTSRFNAQRERLLVLTSRDRNARIKTAGPSR